MSNFTPLVAKQYEFEGDTVKVSFARLKRKDMLKLMPIIQRMQRAEDDAQKGEAIAEMLTDSLKLLPDYVVEFEGLTDSHGNQIDIETVADDMYFMQLASDIVGDLMNESAVGMGGDAKNG